MPHNDVGGFGDGQPARHYFFFVVAAFTGAAVASFFGAAVAFFLSLPWELLPFAMMLTSL